MWICGDEPIGVNWPTYERIVAVFTEIDKVEGDLESARADLLRFGLDPASWHSPRVEANPQGGAELFSGS